MATPQLELERNRSAPLASPAASGLPSPAPDTSTAPVEDKRVDRLFQYTKFHIGIYLSTGGALAAILGSADKITALEQGIGSPWALVAALIAMVLAGFGGGIVASATTRANSFEEMWNERVFWVPVRSWASFEHSMFWISVILIAYSVLCAHNVLVWLGVRS